LIEIRMPKLGSAEVGVVLSWKVEVGARVAKGDILADVETEKATTELESPEHGTIVHLHVPEMEEVPVGTVIAELEARGRG
jgi:pyruvate dehydrogenase E2 component (dihydrolipoamide acetyltransferase)